MSLYNNALHADTSEQRIKIRTVLASVSQWSVRHILFLIACLLVIKLGGIATLLVWVFAFIVSFWFAITNKTRDL